MMPKDYIIVCVLLARLANTSSPICESVRATMTQKKRAALNVNSRYVM